MFNDYRHQLYTGAYGPIAANFGPATLQKYQAGFGQKVVMPGMDTRRFYQQGNWGASYPTNTNRMGGFGYTPPWFNIPSIPPIDVQGIGGPITDSGTQTGVAGFATSTDGGATDTKNLVKTAVVAASGGNAVVKNIKEGANITLTDDGSTVTIASSSGTALQGSATINIDGGDGTVSGKYTHTSAGSPFLNLAVGDAGIEVNFGVGLLVIAPNAKRSDGVVSGDGTTGPSTLNQDYKMKIIAGAVAPDHAIGDIKFVNNMFTATIPSADPVVSDRYIGGVPIDSTDFNDDFDNFPHISGNWVGSLNSSAIALKDQSLTNLVTKQCVIYWYDKDNVMDNSEHATRPYYTMIPEGNFFGKCD